MGFETFRSAGAIGLSALLLMGCQEGTNPFANLNLGGSGESTAVADGATPPPGGRTEERDVDAPQVFGETDRGLWDGRPSLGGVWVAYPDVVSPERVRIRNTESGKETIGALFRREREMPGPRFQVSSEAASELGMLAGQPAELEVVAIRRESIVIEPPPAPEPEAGTTDAPTAQASARTGPAPRAARETAPSIEASPLEPAATAAAALEAVDNAPAPAPAAAPAPAPAAPASGALPGGSYIQIGIFGVKENADNAGESLRLAGIVPTVREQTSGDKTYWRVLVGPLGSAADRAAVLDRVRELGYADAYAITN